MTNGVVLQNELKRALRWLTVSTVVLYLVLAGITGYFLIEARERREALEVVSQRTSTALCAFVHDLERRVETSQEYLQEHPEAEPIPGLTRATIRQGIDSQLQTLEALAPLRCPPEEL